MELLCWVHGCLGYHGACCLCCTRWGPRNAVICAVMWPANNVCTHSMLLHVLSVSICSLTRGNARRACYVCGSYATYASCVAYDLCACEARCESCVRTHTYVHSYMPNCTRVAAVASYTCRRISRQLGQQPAVCRTSQDNASAAAHAGTQFTYCTGTKVQI